MAKQIEDVLLKKPFRRILPNPVAWSGFATPDSAKISVPDNTSVYRNIGQDEFLREYYPTGHSILNPAYYPDRLKTDENNKTYIHYVQRFTSAWQKVITIKHLTHLCGNKIDFTNSNPDTADSQESLMVAFKQGWIKKNMETAWYEAAKSVKITGDAAIAFHLYEGKLGWRVFSYLNDEILYPEFDSLTGQVKTFARKYKTYDENGDSVVKEYVDFYDDKMVTTYERDLSGGVVVKLTRKVFGGNKWKVVARQSHGFDRCPIAYKRCDEGACWSAVQDSIDKYEMAVSQLLENNQTYAFRMLFLKGSTVDIQYDALGQPTAVVGDENSDARYLDKADPSTSFELALKILLQNILSGSFTVLPPEVNNSGNIAGVTIKILYSPAVENGIFDSRDFDSFIDDTVQLFKYGYGIELARSSEFENLDVRGSINVYIHQNDAEIITNINSSVTTKSLSIETAAEIHPYAKSTEKDRLKKQIEEESKREQNGKLQPNPNGNGMNPTNLERQVSAEAQAAAGN